jgi:hypothetical protein
MTFADHIIRFNEKLTFTGSLPQGIRVMNPFAENPDILAVTKKFYKKFYDDLRPRKLILGINPGRFGAGTTGIPFTDTKRLRDKCGIPADIPETHEPSSVFVYDVIERYGGVGPFYSRFYINSISPLGFLQQNKRGNWVNCNYYDYQKLYRALEGFMVESLRKQISFGLDTTTCYVLGKKNARYIKHINEKEKLFGSISVMAHPRYIVQYRARYKNQYIKDYLEKLNQ